MDIETISEDETIVVRRMILSPGEKMFWHTDTCRRFSVVVQGEKLAIEYEDTGVIDEFEVQPGMAGWDEPDPRRHRAINAGTCTYEEVVIFYRNNSAQVPQPE